MTALDLGGGGGVLTNTAFASVASIAAIAMAAKNVLLIFILIPLCGRSRLRGFSTLPSGPDFSVSIYPDGARERSVREFIGIRGYYAPARLGEVFVSAPSKPASRVENA